jgi:hypothetical protein
MAWRTALLAAATAATVTLLPGTAPAVTVAGSVLVDGYARAVELATYGPKGTTIIGYDHGHTITVVIPLRNDGIRPVEVLAVDPFPELLGLLEVVAAPTPLTLQPGERLYVPIEAQFGNCKYYTERAVNQFGSAQVTVGTAAGVTTLQVDYPTEVVVRAPTIVGCPDRVTDRSARQRLLATDD